MADSMPQSVLKETLRLLGIGQCTMQPDFLDKISAIYLRLLESCTPKTVSQVFSIKTTEDSIVFNGELAIHGKDAVGLCLNCRRAVLLAATLGSHADRLIKRMQSEDMSDAVIMDACASAEVEHICDMAEFDILKRLDEGEFLTMRFSPGYGDVKLEESEKIIHSLNATKKIGLSLTKSKLLVPMKSVTALIGISDKKEDRKRNCNLCKINESCEYKKRGEFCDIQDK